MAELGGSADGSSARADDRAARRRRNGDELLRPRGDRPQPARAAEARIASARAGSTAASKRRPQCGWLRPRGDRPVYTAAPMHIAWAPPPARRSTPCRAGQGRHQGGSARAERPTRLRLVLVVAPPARIDPSPGHWSTCRIGSPARGDRPPSRPCPCASCGLRPREIDRRSTAHSISKGRLLRPAEIDPMSRSPPTLSCGPPPARRSTRVTITPSAGGNWAPPPVDRLALACGQAPPWLLRPREIDLA